MNTKLVLSILVVYLIAVITAFPSAPEDDLVREKRSPQRHHGRGGRYGGGRPGYYGGGGPGYGGGFGGPHGHHGGGGFYPGGQGGGFHGGPGFGGGFHGGPGYGGGNSLANAQASNAHFNTPFGTGSISSASAHASAGGNNYHGGFGK